MGYQAFHPKLNALLEKFTVLSIATGKVKIPYCVSTLWPYQGEETLEPSMPLLYHAN